MAADPSRQILATNLLRLIDAQTPKGEKRSVRAWALAKGLDVRLIDRLTKCQHAVTLDNLEKIAEACGLKPWHLLYDDLDPLHPPSDPMTADERELLRKLRGLLGRG